MLYMFTSGIITGALVAIVTSVIIIIKRIKKKKKGHGYSRPEVIHQLSVDSRIIDNPRKEHALEEADE